MSDPRCASCGVDLAMVGKGDPPVRHSSTCPRTTPSDLRHYLERVSRQLVNEQKIAAFWKARADGWKEKVTFWQGKFHSLRLENNALRKLSSLNVKLQERIVYLEMIVKRQQSETRAAREIARKMTPPQPGCGCPSCERLRALLGVFSEDVGAGE